MKTVKVVAAIIIHDGKVFATQRGYGEFKDGWEFPGGKIEPGELPQEALVREIKEELDTEIAVGELIDTVEYDYPEFHLSMDCFVCEVILGNLVLKEHEAARWLGKDELYSVEWLPADWGLIEKIEQKDIIYLTENGKERARALLKEYNLADKDLYERFEFRMIRRDEAEQAMEIEQICFPPNEACSPESMRARIETAPELFLVAENRSTGKLAGFLNGLSTDEAVFRDEFFTDISLYDPKGRNVMLLGLDVLPQYRGQGLAREIVYQYARREREKERELLILTCLQSKVKMYEKFGFSDRGIAQSTWGGEQWHEMSLSI